MTGWLRWKIAEWLLGSGLPAMHERLKVMEDRVRHLEEQAKRPPAGMR